MKIRLALLILLLLVIASIAVTTFIGTGIIKKDVIDIVEHEIPKIQYSLEMEIYINEMAQDVLENLAQVPQENTFADDAEKFRFFHDQYMALEITDHEKELMVQLDAKFEQFVSLGNELIEIEELELIEIEQEHTAKVFELEQMKLLDYDKFHTLLTEMDDILDHQLQVEAVEKIIGEEHETIAVIDSYEIILAVIFIIMLAAVFIFTTRLGKRIQNLVIVTKQVQEGNYDVRVTELKNDEIGFLGKSLNETIIKLQNLNKQKEEFASMITHELKTPLVPIQGFCEMLKDPDMGKLNKGQEDAVDEIYNNSHELLRLIQNVLNAQKIELHRVKFNLEIIDVDKYMKGRYGNLQTLMKEKNTEFVNSTEGDLKIKVDVGKLNEVFTNLVQNAADFVRKEGGRIEMGAKSDGKNVLFYVKDNGIGIPKDKIGNMFQKFYQADATHTRKHGGSGLGLAICKGYIEGLGGKIWLESEEGKGTTFFFTLPKVN